MSSYLIDKTVLKTVALVITIKDLNIEFFIGYEILPWSIAWKRMNV